MPSPFNEKDLMDDIPRSFLEKQPSDIPDTKKSKKTEILDSVTPIASDPITDEEDDEDLHQEFGSRKKRRKDEEFEKQEMDLINKEIQEVEKRRSPWETSISPRSLRSKVISYQAKSLIGVVKPLTCPSHCDTLTFPIVETSQGGEKVILRCSVVTCLHRFDLAQDSKLINHICDHSD